MSTAMGLSSCKEKPPKDTTEDDIVDMVVCAESDIPENQMKEVTLGDHKVLLVKQGGNITAIGNKCSHYGAPLVNGALGDGRVRCPWHGACFNIKTGDIEDFPGLDSVPRYDVSVEDGKVRVSAKKADLVANKRVRGMSRRDPANMKTVVVVGGGAAGASCVESLRQEGFTGRIILICKENHLPYDRPKLSKAMDSQAEKLYLRSHDFYKSFDIELMLGTEVKRVDISAKSVALSKGEDLPYDALFLSTGSEPREMRQMPGGTLKNIMPLRSIEDANKIAAEAKGKRVVMLGNSFIGMEVAAFLAEKVTSLAIVGLSDVPFEPVLGREVGERLGNMFSEKPNITLYGGRALASFTASETDPNVLGSVALGDGTILPADICILGLGVIACTQFIEKSGIDLAPRGGFVTVDKRLKTNAEGVWAGGDIAAMPLTLNGEELSGVAIGHWQVAHYHGKIAGANIAAELQELPEKARNLRTTPFYWTVLFGRSLRYAGYGVGFDNVKVTGDLAELKFVAYYLKKGVVIAVATLNRDPIAAKFAEYIAAERQPITIEQLEAAESESWAI